MRIDKINYYLNIAEACAQRSTCLRRRYGAVLVKNDQIIATGYNGAPRGRKNCIDVGWCIRNELKIPRGTRQELCRAVHAEENVIINASREQMIDSTLYVTGIECENGKIVEGGKPCRQCINRIINAGIKEVYIKDIDNKFMRYDVKDWIEQDDTLNMEIPEKGY